MQRCYRLGRLKSILQELHDDVISYSFPDELNGVLDTLSQSGRGCHKIGISPRDVRVLRTSLFLTSVNIDDFYDEVAICIEDSVFEELILVFFHTPRGLRYRHLIHGFLPPFKNANESRND
jgi:hypothetical protein